MTTRDGESTVTEFTAHPHDGTRVLDGATGKLGIISGQEIERVSWSEEVVKRRVWLAPPGGGYQWPADPAHLTKAPADPRPRERAQVGGVGPDGSNRR